MQFRLVLSCSVEISAFVPGTTSRRRVALLYRDGQMRAVPLLVYR